MDLEMKEIIIVEGATKMQFVWRMLQQFFYDKAIQNSINQRYLLQ
jgi:molecular chaperone DnaK (HSP70)